MFSSADETELFLNGRSLGRKKRGEFEYHFRWDEVKYEAGELQVRTYKNGQPWATESVNTAGPAYKLELQSDRQVIKADGSDLAFITVRVLDKDGNLVPMANDEISFSVNGAAEIVATGGGSWAYIREAQLKSLEVPNTAMVLNIDAGKWNDIHPLDKKTVGERLALAAERLPYKDLKVVVPGLCWKAQRLMVRKSF